MNPADLVSVREALAILCYSDASTITRYVQSGKLTPFRESPRLFLRSDVEALRDQQAAEVTP